MFNQADFDRLKNAYNYGQPCVSIYIPTSRAGSNQKDRIRFKNTLSEAMHQLTDEGLYNGEAMSKEAALKFLLPAYKLLDDENFWLHLSDGLAVFVTAKNFDHFEVPLNFNQFVFVGDNAYLRHLTPLLNRKDRYFILALSQNEVRFFEGRRYSITPVKIKDLVPNGMEEMIGAGDKDQSLQSHHADHTIYHGHGGGKDDDKEQLMKYFRLIDSGLMEMLHDENAPLVIYSVDNQVPIYKEISKYSNLYDVSVAGNPENDDPVMIHSKSWNVVKAHFDKIKQEEKNKFNEALPNEKASFSIHHVVPAAINGKVETLFVDANTDEVWGAYDKTDNTIEIHQDRNENSIALLNAAAVAAFENGGTVYNIPRMDFPQVTAQVNAIYRY